MIYAPVIIPTLNRFDHLKELIVSLQNNTYAKYTELFIGLDYPPNEQYVEGYKKICEYLDSGITGFSQIHIIKREKNYGPLNNVDELISTITEKYDRYIYLEDDCVVSNVFLEYIDKALEKYEKDDKIMQVCGFAYSFQTKRKNANVVYIPIANYWGAGCWVEKDKSKMQNITENYYENKIKKYFNAVRCIFTNTDAFYYIFNCIIHNKKIEYSDYMDTIYYIINHKYSVSPMQTMVHNMGYDGSGVHCDKTTKYDWVNSEELYNSTDFVINDRKNKWKLIDIIRYNNHIGFYFFHRLFFYYLSAIYSFINKDVCKKIMSKYIQ